jgi:hypothetical protein
MALGRKGQMLGDANEDGNTDDHPEPRIREHAGAGR